MYFPNYHLQKRPLDKCLQNPVLEVSSKKTWQKGPKIVEICKTVPLSYLFIPVNIIQLEKAYFSAMQNLKTVC